MPLPKKIKISVVNQEVDVIHAINTLIDWAEELQETYFVSNPQPIFSKDNSRAIHMTKPTEQEENRYLCKKCGKESVCTKPIVYFNCPCGEIFEKEWHIEKLF